MVLHKEIIKEVAPRIPLLVFFYFLEDGLAVPAHRFDGPCNRLDFSRLQDFLYEYQPAVTAPVFFEQWTSP